MSAPAEIIEAEPVRSSALVEWTPRFIVTVDDQLAMLRERDRFYRERLVKGVHYGVIPGTDKPTLLKPGAEALLSGMGLHPSDADDGPPVEDFTGEFHKGETFLMYRRSCRIYRQTGPGEHDRMEVAKSSGSCNSWEPKYRFRHAQLRCPECNKEAVFQSKFKDDDEKLPGFYCWSKKGGCGAKFEGDDKRIRSQPAGKVPNENVAELQNTILKMANKRALIAATLLATGCSDIFTQDVEDMPHTFNVPDTEPKPVTPPKPKPARPPSKPPPPAKAPPAAEPLPPAAEDPERKRVIARIFALADEYAVVAPERGGEFRTTMHDDERRHTLVQLMFPERTGLRDLKADELLQFVSKIERRIEQAIGNP